jgi:hypothetical protein
MLHWRVVEIFRKFRRNVKIMGNNIYPETMEQKVEVLQKYCKHHSDITYCIINDQLRIHEWSYPKFGFESGYVKIGMLIDFDDFYNEYIH